MNGKKRPIGVDLFAGAGGMTLGFEQAGFDVLAAVELDPIHCATHEFNFPFWSILCKSIVETTGEEIRKKSAIGDRDIDAVFGGPPCQGFSLMGKRAFDDPRNSLVFHFLRLVLELNPKYFVMENVRGFTVGKHQIFLAEIIDKFRYHGYEVEEKYQVLNAAHYGVPQNRERLFLLGCRKGFSLPHYPQPITKVAKSNRKNNSHLLNLPSGPTVWDAIGDLPEVEDYPELLERDWVRAKYGPSHNGGLLRYGGALVFNPSLDKSYYSRQLRDPYPAENDYSYLREFYRKKRTDVPRQTSSLGTEHSLLSMTRFAATLPGETEPISRFYKLDPDGICNTLRAGTASNRGAFTSPRPIHPYTPRCITVREAARLHSYPDWFRFHVTKWHGFRQIGNSVPPMLAKAVASEIIRVMGEKLIYPTQNKHLGNERLLELNISQAAQLYGVYSNVIEPRKKATKKEVISGAVE